MPALTDFHDVLLPTYLSYGLSIKLRFKTSVIRMRAGHEERVGEWQDPMRQYDAASALRDQADLDELIEFFRARRGQKYAFRLLDPIDNFVTAMNFGTGDGTTTTFQLSKTYDSGLSGDSDYYVRPIMLLPSTPSIYKDAVLQSSGVTVSLTTGVVTFSVAPALGVALIWTGTFHVPVRFLNDFIYPSIENYTRYESEIPLFEQRSLISATIKSEVDPTDFVETRFPTSYSEQSKIGPKMGAIIIPADSGQEKRITQYTEPKLYFEVENLHRNLADLEPTLHFFMNRKGRLTGFRMKDITDFSVTDEAFAVSDGATASYQLTKSYTSGGQTQVRTITKPVTGTFTIYEDDVPVTVNMTVDTTTGIVLFTLGSMTITFTAATKRFTRTSGSWITNGVTVGRKVVIDGSVSNDGVFTVTSVVSGTIIEVSETVVEEAAVVCEVHYPPEVDVVLTWTGEFDVPVRFDVDEVIFSVTGFEDFNLNTLTFQEIEIALPTFTVETPALAAKATLSGCGIIPLPDQEAVTQYVDFLGSGRAGKLDYGGIFSLRFWQDLRGCGSVTLAFLFSHSTTGGTLFYHGASGSDTPGVHISVGAGGIPLTFESSNGGFVLVAGGTFGGAYTAAGAAVDPYQASFRSAGLLDSPATVDGMRAIVITMDWVTKAVYCSGSVHGSFNLVGTGQNFTVDKYRVRYGTEFSTPEEVLERISQKAISAYESDDEPYGANFPDNSGCLGAKGVFPSGTIIEDQFFGRLYEHFIFFNVPAPGTFLTEDLTVAFQHKPILEYWLSKYSTGFRLVKSPRINAGKGAWYRAGEHTTYNSPEVIETWEPSYYAGGDINTFQYRQSNFGLGETGQPRVENINLSTFPYIDHTLRLPNGAKIR